MPLLEVSQLNVHFDTPQGVVKAVSDLSWQVDKGETLGIVGESGSGKSVACLGILQLLATPPAHISSQEVRFDGLELSACSHWQMRQLRGGRIAMVFQDPMSCMTPHLTIGRQLMEALQAHHRPGRPKTRQQVANCLKEVGLVPDSVQGLYPFQLSGGMLQRVLIAMALLNDPQLLIADEPTTALDVTVQAQILSLIRSLQQRHGMAVIFISHDMGVISTVADRVMVLYGGRAVEQASTRQLFTAAAHPYTRGLLAAVPALGNVGQPLATLPGAPPDPAHLPAGCAFAPRCHMAQDACRQAVPAWVTVGEGHRAACLMVNAEQDS